jgi:hypothetical protein
MIFISSCSSDIEPVKIFLPNNYIGWVYVIHNVENGIKEKDRNYRVYNIPKSGILFSGFKPNTGWVTIGDIHFYYKTDTAFTRLISYYDVEFDDSFKKININKIIGSIHDNINYNDYVLDAIYVDTFKNKNKPYYNDLPKSLHHTLDSIVKADHIKFVQ